MKNWHTYLFGFILSILLTWLSYRLVVENLVGGNWLIFIILIFALVQMAVQLVFFLHLAEEPRPHWNFAMFASTFALILIIVAASLWIMNNLDYRHMTNEQIFDSEAIHPQGR